MKKYSDRGSSRRGQALVGLLVTVAIIIAIAGFYLSAKGKNPDGSTSSHTALRRSIDLAQEVALQSNLNQIQQLIGMYKGDNEGKPPASYDELKRYAKFPDEMWVNPVDKKPLDYNPQTGTMIVQPYEGESPNIIKMTQNPAQGTDTPTASAPSQSTPDAGGAPAMPKMPTLPNSGSSAPADDSQ
jgi:type II secretory pathway pseudopilin PulG